MIIKFDNLTNNVVYYLTLLLLIMGIIVTIHFLRIAKEEHLFKKYKSYRSYIMNYDILSNYKNLKMYRKNSFFRLKNKGKDPCKMDYIIQIDDSYLSNDSNMFLDILED